MGAFTPPFNALVGIRYYPQALRTSITVTLPKLDKRDAPKVNSYRLNSTSEHLSKVLG
jgi:hypothetical protein